MDDLITWLRAQLDEDERVARAEVDLLRDYPYPEDFRVEYQWVRMARHPHGGVSTMFAPGVPSPERMLAEVEPTGPATRRYGVRDTQRVVLDAR
jgi:hypothetical protein